MTTLHLRLSSQSRRLVTSVRASSTFHTGGYSNELPEAGRNVEIVTIARTVRGRAAIDSRIKGLKRR